MKTVDCVAVDLGASSGRVIVGSWSEKRLTLTEVSRFPNAFHSLGRHDYWDLPGLWTEVRAGLVQAGKAFPKLASVGVDTWGIDYVLVDEGGRAVFRPLKTGLMGDLTVEVLTGLQGGEQVIVGPFKALRELRDGDPVRPEARKKAD